MAMRVVELSLAELLRESEHRIETAASSADKHEQLVANRVLGDSQLWPRWESEHAELLRGIVDRRRPAARHHALRSGTFSLIHRMALFDYLQERGLRGEPRRRAVILFHPTRTYPEAMVEEHERYLRSAASFLCICHLGEVAFHDPLFGEPLGRYQEVYSDYFFAHCDNALNGDDSSESDTGETQGSLLAYQKFELNRLRDALLALPLTASGPKREFAIRLPGVGAERLTERRRA
jgi:hypothetical protein